MTARELEIKGVFEIIPQVFGDERGYFMESFNEDKLSLVTGFSRKWVQDNESFSGKGVLRGLHFQLPPHAQSKLVRVVQGSALDVVVDLRSDSPTYGKHVAIELRADKKNQLLIPRGFAHGFLTLEANTLFCYKCDGLYNPEHERVLQWNDPALNIQWPTDAPSLSEKDQEGILLSDFDSPFLMSNS